MDSTQNTNGGSAQNNTTESIKTLRDNATDAPWTLHDEAKTVDDIWWTGPTTIVRPPTAELLDAGCKQISSNEPLEEIFFTDTDEAIRQVRWANDQRTKMFLTPISSGGSAAGDFPEYDSDTVKEQLQKVEDTVISTKAALMELEKRVLSDDQLTDPPTEDQERSGTALPIRSRFDHPA